MYKNRIGLYETLLFSKLGETTNILGRLKSEDVSQLQLFCLHCFVRDCRQATMQKTEVNECEQRLSLSRQHLEMLIIGE